MDDIKEKL